MDHLIREVQARLRPIRVAGPALIPLPAIVLWAGIIVKPLAAQHDGASRALTHEEVLALLQSGVASRRIAQLVEEMATKFAVTREIEAIFRRAGAHEVVFSMEHGPF